MIRKIYTRIRNKLIYKIGVHFPFSKVRARSLRALRHDVGKNVYISDDLMITQNYVSTSSERGA